MSIGICASGRCSEAVISLHRYVDGLSGAGICGLPNGVLEGGDNTAKVCRLLQTVLAMI